MKNKNKCVIIISHCDTDEKKEILIENIEKLYKLENFDIILTSHIPLPEYILKMVDYFIYDKSNPILTWPERSMVFWLIKDQYLLSCYLDDYGWTPFNLIKKGGEFAQVNNYDDYYFMNYDLDINIDILYYFLINTKKTTFFNSKDGDIFFNPGMVFFIIKKDDINIFINSINKEDYKKTKQAEDYLKSLLVNLNYEISNVEGNDLLDTGDGKDLFNNSDFDYFKYFNSNFDISDNKYYKNILIWGIKKDILIETDGYINELKKDEYYLLKYENSVLLIEKDSKINLLNSENIKKTINDIQ